MNTVWGRNILSCPFCGAGIKTMSESYVCECGEQLPEEFHRFIREKCLCGRTLEFGS